MTDYLEPQLFGCIGTIFSGAAGVPMYCNWDKVEEVDLSKIVHKNPILFPLEVYFAGKFEMKFKSEEMVSSKLKVNFANLTP